MANTTNRSYPKPVNSNLVSEDVNLLKQAFDMIDVDVANLLLALAGKAAAAHGHEISAITGLETALSVVVETMVRPGLLDWAGVAERMSAAPAAISGIPGQGRPLAVGEPANLVLIDPEAQWLVEPAAVASRSHNTPFRGLTLPARVRATFLRGRAVVLDGQLQEDRW